MRSEEQAPQTTLSAEVMQKIKRIELRAGHLVNNAFVGGYLSSYKGQGMEWEDVRAYVPGDDVRRIDWKVSAKIGETQIKQYREEREIVVYLLVDVSRSCQFGSQGAAKAERLAELAAALAFCTTRNNDRIGVVFFSHGVEKHIHPGAGKSHIFRLIREILTHNSEQKSRNDLDTKILPAVDFLCKIRKKKTVVFLLSDFLMNDLPDAIKKLSKRYASTLLWIRDALEQSVPSSGIVPVGDAESDEVVWFDFSKPETRYLFAHQRKQAQEKLLELARVNNATLLPLENSDSYIDTVIEFFRKTAKK